MPIVELELQPLIWVAKKGLDPRFSDVIYYGWGPSIPANPDRMVDLQEVALTDLSLFLMHWYPEGYTVYQWQKALIAGDIGGADFGMRREEIAKHRKRGNSFDVINFNLGSLFY